MFYWLFQEGRQDGWSRLCSHVLVCGRMIGRASRGWRQGDCFPTLRSTTLRSWQAWQAGDALRLQ